MKLKLICAIFLLVALFATISESKFIKLKIKLGFVAEDKEMEFNFDDQQTTIKDVGEFYLYSIGMGEDHPKLSVRHSNGNMQALHKTLDKTFIQDGDTLLVRWY